MRRFKKWMMVLGLAGMLGICGCGSSKMSEDMAVSGAADTGDVTSGYAMEETMDAAAADSGDGDSGVEVQAGQKLIVTENLTVETENFDSFVESVNRKTTALGGYIESSEISGAYEYESRNASFQIRIPAEKLPDFITVVDENGTVTYDSKTTEDVTLQYVDTQSHLNALKTEEETLLSLLEKAEKLSDVFEIQQELTEVRYQIESYESQLRVYDNQVDYSTVNLTVYEVSRETTVEKQGFWSEAGAQFLDSLYFVGQVLRGFALWFIGSLPVLVVLAVIVAGIVFAVKKHRRKKREKKMTVSEQAREEQEE